MATATHASKTRLLLELSGLLPEAKLFLIALSELGDLHEAERLVGLSLEPPMLLLLQGRGLLDGEARLNWDGVRAHASRTGVADARVQSLIDAVAA